MSDDEKSAGTKGRIAGWLKGAVTSLLGLASGAFIMYLTPVVNSAIKPAKPVANFSTQISGLTVTFNNRTTGAVQGWWDFGDGSALEPFDPKTEIVKHVYPRPGTYATKLSVQSLFGDDSDRSVSITATEGGGPSQPEFEAFQLASVSPTNQAPAVFRLVSKVKNAGFCILSYGDSRPTEILDAAPVQERYLMFNEKGTYTVRFAAVNGKQVVEKTQVVSISPGDARAPLAKLRVVYDAVKVERTTKEWRIPCGWRPDSKGDTASFRRERPASPGWTVVAVELVNQQEGEGPVRNAKVEIAPEKTKIVLTGEAVKPSGFLKPKTLPPRWLAHVKATLERRAPAQKIDRGAMMMAINLNSAIRIPFQPLHAGWEVARKQVKLELWDAGRKVWETSTEATNASVALNGQACLVTALPQTDGFLLKVATAKGGVIPDPTIVSPQPVGPIIRRTGFERNPLLKKRP
ncbi:MAG: hypothetical protein HYX68_23680 [Planctomycetes bacterium]|nr:hypothetical protein [Planctomycetota bacterium]